MDIYKDAMKKLEGITPEALDVMIEVMTMVRDAKLGKNPDDLKAKGAGHAANGWEDLKHQYISKALLELGMPQHLKGHRYMLTALKLIVDDDSVVEAVTKVIYPFVAKTHQTTPSRVERAIRHAIEVTWDRTAYETIEKYFGATVNPHKGKPTNTEFFATMGNKVREDLKNDQLG